MSGNTISGILSRIAGRDPNNNTAKGYDPLHAPASAPRAPSALPEETKPPVHGSTKPAIAAGEMNAAEMEVDCSTANSLAKSVSPNADESARLDSLIQNLSQLQQLSSRPTKRTSQRADGSALGGEGSNSSIGEGIRSARWIPPAPSTLHETGLFETDVETIALKFLNHRGEANGREIAAQLRLPFVIVEPVLAQMKVDQKVYYRGSAAINDYIYQLTENGRTQARALADVCTYFGSAPVSLRDYNLSVAEQSLTKVHPSPEDVSKAFSDLILDPDLIKRLGPAINSGRGLFLYGYPGNGKTSVAERITLSFGECIWIPRALHVDGEIVRLFDPGHHTEVPLQADEAQSVFARVDQRWVRIKRPTIIVGGELTMDQLEITYNRSTGLSEAPFQLKSNCGTLVIDDFGRQKMRTDELLNRWIVPLEKRYDFLNLASGKKIQVPFDQLVVFSTNLEPKDLVDEAFLRRIPYKIHVPDPTEAQFRKLFSIFAKKMEIRVPQGAVDYLVQKHYQQGGRRFRGCHPRDLLTQIKNLCMYSREPLEATPENLDFAVENYFSMM